MESIIIFGKNYVVVEKKSNVDSVKLRGNKIVINSCKNPPHLLLKEFLSSLLYSELHKIYNEILKRKKVDVFANLDFEITEKIDGKRNRIAKLEGNKILVKLNAVALPKSALKYIVAHEIAHVISKRHTSKFWKIVKTIYPNFEKGQKLLTKHAEMLIDPLAAFPDDVERDGRGNKELI
ncbi:MAG: YgjP-like metallopeptidase domain-containing protein [Fervidicoccaceae archaeon]